ncbi:MAG: hypothetical protein L3K08_07580, partial [Thermoplasmata archaeon]|nr:hypothetical protein [Thermoplasmata archaeon]
MAIRIAGPASLLLVVLLAAPWTAASGPIRLTAPYHHVVFTSNSTTNHTLSRCERYAADVAPHWNPASGAGGFDYRVSARSCPRSLYSSAEGNGSLQLLIPVHGALGSSNRSNVTLNWTVRAYLGIRAVVPGTCPSVVLNSTGDGGQGCEIDAAALLLTRVGLWDSTNGKFWDFSPKGSASTTEMLRLTVVNSTRCISYVCSSGNSTTGQPAVLRMNSTFSV